MFNKKKSTYTKNKLFQEEFSMRFFKGVLVGTMFAAGTAIMYKEGMLNGSKIIKKGKKIAKKMGVM